MVPIVTVLVPFAVMPMMTMVVVFAFGPTRDIIPLIIKMRVGFLISPFGPPFAEGGRAVVSVRAGVLVTPSVRRHGASVAMRISMATH